MTIRVLGRPALCAWALVVIACSTGANWEGAYLAEASGPAAGKISLVLEAGGKGRWMLDGEITPLVWEVRDSAIWLHLKSGAVLIAETDTPQKALTMKLSGTETLVLRRKF